MIGTVSHQLQHRKARGSAIGGRFSRLESKGDEPRMSRVRQLRAAIASGEYDLDGRLDACLPRLMRDLAE